MGLFQSLETGKRALLAHQLSLTTTGQNISNVDTPGYSRQRVRLAATDPSRTMNGIVGTGVSAVDVRSVRDLFLGRQFRQESKSLGDWQYREKILSQVETMFNEPSDDSLRQHLDDFWNSWQQLSNAPESRTARNDIVAKANIVGNDFRQLSSQLSSLKDSVDGELGGKVGEINRISREIADLNRQISRSEVDGTSANDLRDRRDLLIDTLSPLVDVNVIEDKNGAARVMIGSMAIVDGQKAYKLDVSRQFVNGSFKSALVFAGTAMTITNRGGEVFAVMQTRDQILPAYSDKLDELARTFASEVNNIHMGGYGLRPGSGAAPQTGLRFFTADSLSAGSLRVESGIQDDPTLIAASLSGEPGDASNALKIANLRSGRFINGGSMTLGEGYASLVGRVGVDSSQSKNHRVNFELVVQQVENARQSVQGVSLDEEMANLIQSQHAYEAAARIITTVDQAFETVIKGMGITGR